jgi:hypothetical protein
MPNSFAAICRFCTRSKQRVLTAPGPAVEDFSEARHIFRYLSFQRGLARFAAAGSVLAYSPKKIEILSL